jgi:hypothetical protein
MNNFPGRNDHIHGDEDTHAQNSDDVIEIIATNAKGSSAWVDRLRKTDVFDHFIFIITRDRDNPAFAMCIDELEAAINGILHD